MHILYQILNNMENQDIFINIELFNKLKEVDYNLPLYRTFKTRNVNCENAECLFLDTKEKIDKYSTQVLPLYDQVVYWLNKEHGLFICFEDERHGEPTDKLPYGFRYYVTQYGHCVIGRSQCYNTYEEARIKAVISCINYIKDVINLE